MRADFLRRYEKAKEKGFRGSIDDFIRRIENMGLKKGGPVKNRSFGGRTQNNPKGRPKR